MKHLLYALLLLLLAFVVTPVVTRVEAQCQVRTEWAVYVVERGDSLTAIARRFGTNVNALIQGNCLTNTRIIPGQQIRVPGSVTPTPAPLVENPNGTFLTFANYRQYENGFMIWRSDNGTIYVFTTNGAVRSYPLSSYGNLPLPAQPLPPPSGLFAPTFGMARLWYNVVDVQQALGWATDAAETGFNPLFQMPSFGAFFTMTRPDNTLIRVNLDGTWASVDVTPTATMTNQPGGLTGATFQAFDNGFMVWRADNGEIRVYVGGESGELTIFPNARYAGLPLPGGFTAPPNRFVPIGGFGKVWRNVPEIRARIGFAVGSEQGYTMGLTMAGTDVAGFSLPDRRYVYGSGTSWRVAGDFYVPTATPTFAPTATGPTPTASPTSTAIPTVTSEPGAPQIGTTYQPFEGGFMLWRADSSDIWVFLNTGPGTGEITVIPNEIYSTLPIDRRANPPAGRVRPDSGFGRVWSNFTQVRQRLGWGTGGEQGYLMLTRILANGDTWSFQLPDGRFVSQANGRVWTYEGVAAPSLTPTWTPTAAPTGGQSGTIAIGAVYQPYDLGFMLYRTDDGSILVYFSQAGTVSVFSSAQYGRFPIDRQSQVPTGRLRPDNGFGRLWSNFPDVRNGLGWALSPEQGYVAQVVVMNGAPTRFTLPEGGLALEQVSGSMWRIVSDAAPAPVTATPMVTATATAQADTPPAPTAVNSSIQCFESGYMLWRSDTEMIYVLTNRGDSGRAEAFTKPEYATLSEPSDEPPSGLVRPILGFGRVWQNLPGVRDELGWATSAENYYTAAISAPTASGIIEISIPGGGTVILSPGAWTFGPNGNTLMCP
jgi:hypothetical protein